MKFSNRARLLASTLFVASVMHAAPALAQDDTEEAQEDAGIIVTGSRIQRPQLEGNSPVTVVSGDQTIENGDITLDTFLNTLPQVNPAGTTTSNNPGNNGRANINLRGLGSNRNLVLIDGRRPMVSASDQTVDLNTIPQALIQRVDVVTGGAGAAYGADAIAGVVNIILKDDFEGIDLRTSYSLAIPQKDARDIQISGTIGGNFAEGRGNMAVSFDYADRRGLIKKDRPFAAQATSTTGTPPVGRLFESANAIPQTAIDTLFRTYGVLDPQLPVAGLSQLHFNSDGTLFGSGVFNTPLNVSNYRYAANGTDAAAANQNFFPDFYSYNFDAINLLVLPMERKSAFLRANYELSPSFDVFIQAGWTEYSSADALAPTPIGTRIYNPTTPGGVTFATSPLISPGSFVTQSVVPTTNPFIPANLRTLLNARTGDDPTIVGSGPTEAFKVAIRTLGTGLRQSDYQNQVIQGLVGVRGDIAEGWRYEAYYSWGRTTIDRAASGNVNVQQLQRLLEAPDGGASLCTGGYNPFGIQPLSAACATFLDETGFTKTRFTQNIAQAYVSGELGQLPGGTVSAVAGVESRNFRYTFDPGALSGPIAGFNTATPDLGTNSFLDFFGELLVPVVSGVEASLGYRHSTSDFNDLVRNIDGDSVGSSAYKAELSWSPVSQVRLRASYQHSVRAPNFGELFSGGASFVSAFDPCTFTTNFRKNGGTTARDLCIRNGVGGGNTTATITPGMITAADGFVATPGLQVNTNFAGNANLMPEESDTITAGAVFNIGGLTGSLDYYNIRIADKIFGPDTNMLIAACYGYQGGFNTSLSPTSPYCTSVGRAGSSLSAITVAQAVGGNAQGFFTQINQGTVQTSGIDFQLAYNLPTTFVGEDSALNFNLYVNYLIDFKVEELPGVVLDYAGSVSYFGQGLGSSYPRWKGYLNTSWDIGAFTLSGRTRYIDKMVNRASIQFPGEKFTGVPAVWYFDFAVQAEVENMTLRVGLNNAFNKQPPLYAPNVQSGTDPSLYDVVGRRIYVQTRVKF